MVSILIRWPKMLGLDLENYRRRLAVLLRIGLLRIRVRLVRRLPVRLARRSMVGRLFLIVLNMCRNRINFRPTVLWWSAGHVVMRRLSLLRWLFRLKLLRKFGTPRD